MFMLAVFTFGAFLCAFDETLTPQLGQSLGYLLMVFSADLLYYYYEFGSKREYSNKHKLYACFGWWTLFCVLVLWLYESLVAIFT